MNARGRVVRKNRNVCVDRAKELNTDYCRYIMIRKSGELVRIRMGLRFFRGIAARQFGLKIEGRHAWIDRSESLVEFQLGILC